MKKIVLFLIMALVLSSCAFLVPQSQDMKISHVSIDGSSVQINWVGFTQDFLKEAFDVDTEVPVDYVLSYMLFDNLDDMTHVTVGRVNSYTIDNLNVGTKYAVKITASNFETNSLKITPIAENNGEYSFTF